LLLLFLVRNGKEGKQNTIVHKCPPHGHPFCFPRDTHKDIKILNEKKLLLLLLLAKTGELFPSCCLLRLQRWVRLDNFGGYLETNNRTFFVRARLMGRSSVRARHRQKP
jgi:hypothetical protein